MAARGGFGLSDPTLEPAGDPLRERYARQHSFSERKGLRSLPQCAVRPELVEGRAAYRDTPQAVLGRLMGGPSPVVFTTGACLSAVFAIPSFGMVWHRIDSSIKNIPYLSITESISASCSLINHNERSDSRRFDQGRTRTAELVFGLYTRSARAALNEVGG